MSYLQRLAKLYYAKYINILCILYETFMFHQVETLMNFEHTVRKKKIFQNEIERKITVSMIILQT